MQVLTTMKWIRCKIDTNNSSTVRAWVKQKKVIVVEIIGDTYKIKLLERLTFKPKKWSFSDRRKAMNKVFQIMVCL